MDFSNINYLAVIVSGLAAFALGSIWYTFLFGKSWQSMITLDADKAKKNMARTMISSFVLMTVMAFGLALLISGHEAGQVDWKSGMHLGALAGFFIAAMTTGINYLYQQKPFKLWLIDSLYVIIFLAAEGAILGAWPK